MDNNYPNPTDPIALAKWILTMKYEEPKSLSRIVSEHRPFSDEFALGFEMGIGEFENFPNMYYRLNSSFKDILTTPAHYAGYEFGEAVGDALKKEDISTLLLIQSFYKKACRNES